MHTINFTKIVASGNDFVIVEKNKLSAIRCPLSAAAKSLCDRKYGIGADGLLVLEKSRIADIRMRVFNADGSEAEMCGNGARAVALWANSKLKIKNSKVLKIETKAGMIESEVSGESVKIKLTNPKHIKTDIKIKINQRPLKVDFIDTGVPHTVIFVEGSDKIDVLNLGRAIRYHKQFSPRGTNVNFVEVLGNDSIKVRTYERGVENETLACGTGAVASSLLFAIRYPHFDFALVSPTKCPEPVEGLYVNQRINVITQSGEPLKVYFDRVEDKFTNVWLEGRGKTVYRGEYYV